ncbi:ribosomal protein S18-alanine N-acetyltransferase [Bifidobacterium felsineum]|uniref:Ribosomal-protein-alanine N-acetyltransferase n=1 Tax=Bifidobacterium felsineum TaxID=2045440 RepID=A0A2M9HK13_9BIFI|nr:ribosomal protein S18-alanine N-acetyltransferase [Bifidobacterium felsineum]MBT1165047.1 ribosomal protein S18-alanine N-acetyltransferase [Bifidobacterium felsineum]PJM77158.1 ribosomal-protein-alanine N-acetyltransferase [Bifidobacterium felsineum]
MLIDANELGHERAIAAMRSLEVELFGNHAWSEASVRQEIEGEGRTYIFDADSKANTIRGFAGYWYDGEDAEIMDVGVGKTYQRQGIARALMTELIARARQRGARRMLLEVSVINEPAIALYKGFGFERIGLRKRYYQPEGIDAYVMALDFEPRIIGFQSASGGPDNDAADNERTDEPYGTER